MVMAILAVSVYVNIRHPLTEHSVLVSVEICKTFFLKQFLRNRFLMSHVIAVSSIDGGFLPSVLFGVVWNVDIPIMSLFSLLFELKQTIERRQG